MRFDSQQIDPDTGNKQSVMAQSSELPENEWRQAVEDSSSNLVRKATELKQRSDLLSERGGFLEARIESLERGLFSVDTTGQPVRGWKRAIKDAQKDVQDTVSLVENTCRFIGEIERDGVFEGADQQPASNFMTGKEDIGDWRTKNDLNEQSPSAVSWISFTLDNRPLTDPRMDNSLSKQPNDISSSFASGVETVAPGDLRTIGDFQVEDELRKPKENPSQLRSPDRSNFASPSPSQWSELPAFSNTTNQSDTALPSDASRQGHASNASMQAEESRTMPYGDSAVGERNEGKKTWATAKTVPPRAILVVHGKSYNATLCLWCLHSNGRLERFCAVKLTKITDGQSNTFLSNVISEDTSANALAHTGNRNQSIMLTRPARERSLAFEAPFTLKRFWTIVRQLYPNTEEGVLEVLLMNKQGEELTEKTPYWEYAEMEEEVFQRDMNRRVQMVDECWVIKHFTQVRIQDGRNRSKYQMCSLDFISHTPEESMLFSHQVVEVLLGAGVWAMDNPAVVIQVDRFKGEWLTCSLNMSPDEFEKMVWKIDDPDINIYPGGHTENFPFNEVEGGQAELQRELNQSANIIKQYVLGLQRNLATAQKELDAAQTAAKTYQLEKGTRRQGADEIQKGAVCPYNNCNKNLANESGGALNVIEIMDHARLHFIHDRMQLWNQRCAFPLCHAILADLPPDEQEEHRVMHESMRSVWSPRLGHSIPTDTPVAEEQSQQIGVEAAPERPQSEKPAPEVLAPDATTGFQGADERPTCKKGEKRYCDHCFACTATFNTSAKRQNHFKKCNGRTKREICLKPEAAKQKKAEDKVREKQDDEINKDDEGNESGIAGDRDSRDRIEISDKPPESLSGSKKRKADEQLKTEKGKQGKIDEDGVGVLGQSELSMQSGDSERSFEAIYDSAVEPDEDSNEDNDDTKSRDKDEDISIFGIRDYNEDEDETYDPWIGLRGRVDVVRKIDEKGIEEVDEEEGEYDEEAVKKSQENPAENAPPSVRPSMDSRSQRATSPPIKMQTCCSICYIQLESLNQEQRKIHQKKHPGLRGEALELSPSMAEKLGNDYRKDGKESQLTKELARHT